MRKIVPAILVFNSRKLLMCWINTLNLAIKGVLGALCGLLSSEVAVSTGRPPFITSNCFTGLLRIEYY